MTATILIALLLLGLGVGLVIGGLAQPRKWFDAPDVGVALIILMVTVLIVGPTIAANA